MTVIEKENNQLATENNEKIDSNQSNEVNAQTQPLDSKEENKEDPNWKAFREARKKDRSEKEAAERKALEKEQEVAALKAAMEAAFSRQQPQSTQGYPEEETEDQRIEKKVQAIISQREAIAERERQEREQREYPNKLNQVYHDFNNIVSAENLDYLEYHYPEVARPLKRQSEGFDKWSDIYHAIKKFVPNHATAKKEAAKAENNFNRPKSMSSTGLSQSGNEAVPLRLSEERKAANWKRMQQVLGGIG